MLEQENAEADCAPVLSAIPWNVAEVEALPDFCLRVRFNDGLEGIADLNAFLHAPDAGVFSALSSAECFATVAIEMGAVTWPNVLAVWPWTLDLAPDAMHDEIARNGTWVL